MCMQADVRRFDVKDKRDVFHEGVPRGVCDWKAGAFQLESLILAQNERWRQA